MRRDRALKIAAAAAFSAAIAALLAIAPFTTTDFRGFHRIRTARFVWQTAAARLPHVASAPLVGALYAAGAVTVVGFFVLLWLAIALDDDRSRELEGETSLARIGPGPLLRPPARLSPVARRMCLAAMALLAGYTAWRMGLFAPLRVFGVSDTFASFDHPFHIARAETLVRSLQHHRALRWVANHQGGYPAEFYPFGFAWFEALLWALAAGRLPVPIVHRAAVILLFLAPAVLFHAMARRDDWPASVAVAAFALHVAVPGDMWAGGYCELVLVGLVANVSAALAVVTSMVAAAYAFAGGSRRAAALSAAAAAGAIWCNPRSGIALAVCVGAAWATAVWRRPWRRATVLLAGIAAGAALLAAPELASLLRFQRLYYFIRYTAYGSSLDYTAAAIDAVSLPAFALAVVGLVAAWIVDRRRVITRTVGVALVAYVAMTLVFTFGASAWIQQLETTRLMPVQRLLTIYAAAVGLHVLTVFAFDRWRVRGSAALAAQAGVVAALLAIQLGPHRLLPYWSRGLYDVQRSGVPEMATFQQVLAAADQEAPPGTAILVVGTAIAGHQQLWAPVRTDRLFFYDEWMWYWHRRHRGPYDPRIASRYDPHRLDEVFARGYLDRNAIGAVVVIAADQAAADHAPALQRLFGGAFGLYAVSNPVRVVTLAGRTPDTLAIANESITCDGTSDGGEALIRRNWFPRWRATVNGQTVPIAQTDDGYMRVQIPAGRVHLALTYDLDPVDVLARAAAIAGVVVLIGCVAVGNGRRAERSVEASHATTSPFR